MESTGSCETLGSIYHVTRLDIPDGRNLDVEMVLREVGHEDEGGINLAKDIFQWRAFVNRVMSLRVS
jgi:hypothetical protein